ncbi:ACP S-malonyltransferase [candidate division KSB1 bacterium]|nr:ACP S-malonyltransferase [candidate division KSB1 bacterium]
MTKLAFLFPGQASQYVGMGRDLYHKFPFAHRVYDKASDLLGFDLKKISFEGPEEELKQTKITQPAIFVHSYVLSEILKERGIKPAVAAGHSLGEYSALVCADALDFEEALTLVKLRGELMQKAGEDHLGTMAAVMGLTEEVVKALCGEASVEGVVKSANFNSPGQIVISGTLAGVHRAMALAEESGARIVKELVVSGAFHSPLMEDARRGLGEALKQTSVGPAKIPVYANVNARPVTGPGEIRDLLVAQLTHPVRWAQSVGNMIRDGVNLFYEVGPGRVLQGLLKRIDRGVTCQTVGTVGEIANIFQE